MPLPLRLTTNHIPPNYVVEDAITHRKPPEVRIWIVSLNCCDELHFWKQVFDGTQLVKELFGHPGSFSFRIQSR